MTRFWLLAMAVLTCACKAKTEAAHDEPARTYAPPVACVIAARQKQAAQPPTPAKPLADVLTEREKDWDMLVAVIADLRPEMKDVTGDSAPVVALPLLRWAVAHHPKIEDFIEADRLGPTTPKMVIKDSDAERGKIICVPGRIVQISVDKIDGEKVYGGGIYADTKDIVRFVAYGTSGDLVEDSFENFCGVVIGRQTYKGGAGTTVNAVYVVGMFDLPGNHRHK